MYAVVETGGKQYKVEPNTLFKVEKLEGEKGDNIDLSKVLLVEKDGDLKVGKPYLDGAVVKTEIQRQEKGKKIVVFRYKPKKRVRVKTGHRQKYTLLKVKEILS